jgi:hypothetical protein
MVPPAVDTEWVRNKEEIMELFADEPPFVGGTKKRIFPRLPLHSTFVGLVQESEGGGRVDFDFHMVGVRVNEPMRKVTTEPTNERRVQDASQRGLIVKPAMIMM